MTPRQRAEAIAFLRTEAGAELLALAATLPNDRLTRLSRLRRHCSPDIAAGVVELLELRRRARTKFGRSDALFLTPDGLEQATSPAVARYRASRFPPDASLLDACCGVGSDACALAERGKVLAVDSDLATCLCAQANGDGRFPVLCADLTSLDFARLRRMGFASAFFDPSRRADSPNERRRIQSGDDYLPPLSWVETLRARLPNVAVKVSPAIDDATLARFPEAEIEFVSERGECKEATLWFGDLRETPNLAGYRAIVLDADGVPHQLLPQNATEPRVSAPRSFLYEPDPAVIRAHRLPELAERLEATLLEPRIAYLTADYGKKTPFATVYRVLDWMPYHLKRTQAKVKEMGRRVVAIKKRGVPIEPEAIRKQLLGATDAEETAVVVLTRQGERILALICEVAL